MSFLTRAALLFAMLSILTTPVPAHAQGDAAVIEGDLPIESYLSLLSQVAPAAREPADRSSREDRSGGEQLAARQLSRDQPLAAHADSRRAASSPRGEHRATASSASSALS